MSNDASTDQILFQRLLAYFERQAMAAQPPIPHPDKSVDLLAFVQLESLRTAAVLIPITRMTKDNESRIVLTVRSENLKSHAGQISLPGGSQDAQDNDVIATALRESEEEIGLAKSQVQVIGRLGELALPSGFRVTPIVGIIDPGLQFTACPIEVADIFHVPLSLILNPRAYRRSEMQFDNQPRTILELTFEDYRIWGATAAILHHLAVKIEQHV